MKSDEDVSELAAALVEMLSGLNGFLYACKGCPRFASQSSS
jgi:hypothetical protein